MEHIAHPYSGNSACHTVQVSLRKTSPEFPACLARCRAHTRPGCMSSRAPGKQDCMTGYELRPRSTAAYATYRRVPLRALRCCGPNLRLEVASQWIDYSCGHDGAMLTWFRSRTLEALCREG